MGKPALTSDWLIDMGLRDVKQLLALIRKQYAPLFAAPRTICFVGPVNTGKSSLYNTLLGNGVPRAQVSPVPGTTRDPQTGDAEAFLVLDTPGANELEVGAEGPREAVSRRAAALEAARQADVLVMVFDAAHGIGPDELGIYQELKGLGKPFVVALNKIDLVGRDQEAAVAAAAARALQLPVEEITTTSATRGTNVGQLLAAILEQEPELLATLAERAPACRWILAGDTILRSAGAAATANLLTSPVEIPFASFVPITAIQVAMALKLARIHGLEMSPARAKEILLTLGSGFLGRTLFYQLANLVPGAGWLVGTAIAGGTTLALGYALAAWFAHGERPTREAAKRLTESTVRTLIAELRGLGGKQAVRERLQGALAAVWQKMSETGKRTEQQ